MRYAIIGSGAVGGLYGGLLAHHGQDVHFLLHSDFEHVKQHGLRIDSVCGDFVLDSPNVYRDVNDMPRCDVVIVAMKSTNNHLLENLLPPVLANDGVVLTLQNGLDVEADCVSVLKNRNGLDGDGSIGNEILGGCCFLCSNKVGPGHVHHLDYGRIVFGRYEFPGAPATRGVGDQILADMEASGIDAKWADDLAAARWRKLMWNIPFNGLSVALDASTHEIIQCPSSRALAKTIVREVHRGAASCGVSIDPSAINKTIEHTETMVPYDSSMRLDFLNGREMEIVAIFSNPLRAVEEATTSEDKSSPGNAVGFDSAIRSDAVLPDCRQIMPSVSMLCQQLQFLDSRRGTASKADR